jgi:transposase
MAPRLKKHDAAAIDRILREHLEDDYHKIAATYLTTYSTIMKRRRKIQIEEAIGHPYKAGKMGFSSKATPEVEDFVRRLLEDDSDLYQDEIADYIWLEYTIQLSQPSISRLLRRIKHTRKQVTVTPIQRDEELVQAWRRKMLNWDAQQLVFLDEAASNERTTDRKYGYAPSGAPAYIKRWLKRSVRWSVLPALDINGWFAPLSYQGSITAQIFEDWLENHVLPACNNAPGCRNIIIMDNASIHKSQRVIDLCTRWNVDIEYLPPYSPFLNPIEETFHDLKQHIRRYWRWTDVGGYDEFEAFLLQAVVDVGTGLAAAQRARAHFRHSGYIINGGDI